MFPVQFGVQMKNRSSHCAHIADQLHFGRITGYTETMHSPTPGCGRESFRRWVLDSLNHHRLHHYVFRRLVLLAAGEVRNFVDNILSFDYLAENRVVAGQPLVMAVPNKHTAYSYMLRTSLDAATP